MTAAAAGNDDVVVVAHVGQEIYRLLPHEWPWFENSRAWVAGQEYLLVFGPDDTSDPARMRLKSLAALPGAVGEGDGRPEFLVDLANDHILRLEYRGDVGFDSGHRLSAARAQLLGMDRDDDQWRVLKEWGPAPFLVSRSGRSLVLLGDGKPVAIDLAGGGQVVEVPGLDAMVSKVLGLPEDRQKVTDTLRYGAIDIQFGLTDGFDFYDSVSGNLHRCQTGAVERPLVPQGGRTPMKVAVENGQVLSLISEVVSLAHRKLRYAVIESDGQSPYEPVEVPPESLFLWSPSEVVWDAASGQILFRENYVAQGEPRAMPLRCYVWNYRANSLAYRTIDLGSLIEKHGDRFRLVAKPQPEPR